MTIGKEHERNCRKCADGAPSFEVIPHDLSACAFPEKVNPAVERQVGVRREEASFRDHRIGNDLAEVRNAEDLDGSKHQEKASDTSRGFESGCLGRSFEEI